MLKKFCIHFLALSLLISLNVVTALASFSDVSEDYLYYDAVSYVQSEGIVDGYDDGTYLPDALVNRAEFTKIIVNSVFTETRIENCNMPKNVFPDFDHEEWFTPYVCVAYDEEVIGGYPDGSFQPANMINFVEAAKIVVEGFDYEITESDVWYEPYLEILETYNAVPEAIGDDLEHEMTRGEIAHIIYVLLESQVFEVHEITTDAVGARATHAADLDGDGDLDVLSVSTRDDKVAWYENDGSGSFTAHTITTDADGVHSVYAADLDDDGDLDVLSASQYDNTVAWYENDGSESFTKLDIATDATTAKCVHSEDLDGDGDMDVVAALTDDNTVVWYENDGSESFTAHTITTEAEEVRTVFASDLDDDGDVDVLSASITDGTIAWYENDGNGEFEAHDIADAKSARTLYVIDMDEDGDLDVVANSKETEVSWYENDGSENFTGHVVAAAVDVVTSVYAGDLDGDGDLDILSASSDDDTVAWYENPAN